MRLTKDEIILVAVVLIALVVGASVKHYRATHRAVKPASGIVNPDL